MGFNFLVTASAIQALIARVPREFLILFTVALVALTLLRNHSKTSKNKTKPLRIY